jgi:Family of unknown function (DUF5677)
MKTACELDPWFALADGVREQAMRLLDNKIIDLGGGRLAQPKVFAAALLARTMTNHRGAVVLARSGLIVETRTLTRSCFENVIWLRSLKADGAVFVEKILDDIAAQRVGFAKALLPNAAFLGDEDRKELQREAMMKTPDRISLSDKVDELGSREDYIMFRALSDDAVHTSGTSLNRHTPRDANGMIADLFVEPPVDTEEMVMTLHFATASLINAMELYSEIVPAHDAELALNAAKDMFRATVQATGLGEED